MSSTIGKRLERQRRKKFASMRAAARAAGIDPATAMHLERQEDECIAALGALRRYAQVLDFDVAIVLRRKAAAVP